MLFVCKHFENFEKMQADDGDCIKNICKKFKTVTTEPELFLQEQPSKCDNILEVIRDIYRVTVDNDDNSKSALVLPRLVIEDMDEEQVWQQLEVRNDSLLPQFLEKTSKLLAMNDQKYEIRLQEDESDAEKEEEENDNELNNDNDANSESKSLSDDDDDELDDKELEDIKESKKPKKKMRSSIVDDKFFKLDEMEEFCQAEDDKEMRKKEGKPKANDVDEIDYFAEDFGLGMDSNESDDDDDDNEDDANLKYNDFFDKDQEKESKLYGRKEKGKDYFAENESSDHEFNEADEKKVESDEQEEEEEEVQGNTDDGESKSMEPASDTDSDSIVDDEKNEEPKSSFELREKRLKERIREYEQIVLGEKPWPLKGEVQGTNRPHNSLLEEILEFDANVRPPPLITEATTKCLEDIIKQRIRDKAWDDVVPKVRPIKTPHEYRKQLVLDQEKSKESLAQIYEKEYQREMDKLKPRNLDEAAEDEPKEHQEIRQRMRALFVKLDALSNFHFTPKPVAPEPKIITNTPAIAMEEVAPVAVSDANLLAPEEVYRGPRHELVGKSERDRTDKNRERRKKKSKQRAVHKALEERDLHRQKMGIPLSRKEESAKLLKTVTKHRNVEKMTSSNDQSALKSSKAFFSKLQDTKTLATKTKAPKRKPDAKSLSAKKLKL